MIPYSFSVLRYMHDVVTGEFINVGVAVFSADIPFLRARCTNHYSRINRTFHRIDCEKFKQLMRHIEDEVNLTGHKLQQRTLPFADLGASLETLLARVLPVDDSGIRFSEPGYGVSADLQKTLDELHHRYVDQYAAPQDAPSRTDEDVWRIFRTELEKRHVLHQLTPKLITAPDYEYEFKAAWKNSSWHVYEPVSLDLTDPNSIIDKANRWLGRMTNLAESIEPFHLHLLLGMPDSVSLRHAANKARKILDKMPTAPHIVTDENAGSFARDLEQEIEHHEAQPKPLGD